MRPYALLALCLVWPVTTEAAGPPRPGVRVAASPAVVRRLPPVLHRREARPARPVARRFARRPYLLGSGFPYADASPDFAEPGLPPPEPPVPDPVPSLAALPASTGIAPDPRPDPVVYVLYAERRPVARGRGVRVVNADGSGDEDDRGGAKVIHLLVPKGR
jgi:hypothetical protein